MVVALMIKFAFRKYAKAPKRHAYTENEHENYKN
jgi:hypothetical protein